ncbi:uncharacterized protein LOC133194308 [Saccostrea echinata]|uniref:uncharacterized protein LOC133194308 n=1 Tax=Saccostrea echinata TaxID=191078 RepID=UPI002A82D445|nr:uncharacterized protein LOC133194308 [Saccostrea echinata]
MRKEKACENHVSTAGIVGRKRSLSGHRSYAPCSGCCKGDLCNINCNATFTSGTIINIGTTSAPAHVTEIPGNYAFYAHLTSSTKNDYVISNNITSNKGLAYSGSTGIFTCKYSGPFVFSWTIATSNQRYTGADLLINDIAIGSSFTDSRGSSITGDSSTRFVGFVTHDLQFWDKVRVKVNGTADAMLSTFSGWLLNYNDSYFYARALTSLTRPTSPSYGFKFQDVISNNGHVYNSEHGTFVCPESGLYAFALSLEAHHRDFMVYFYRNDKKFKPYKDTSSTLQLFHLTRGDRVYLYPPDSDSTIEPMDGALGHRVPAQLLWRWPISPHPPLPSTSAQSIWIHPACSSTIDFKLTKMVFIYSSGIWKLVIDTLSPGCKLIMELSDKRSLMDEMQARIAVPISSFYACTRTTSSLLYRIQELSETRP